MAIKVRYTYTDYKGFPAATDASRRFNASFAIAGLITIPLAIGIGAFFLIMSMVLLLPFYL